MLSCKKKEKIYIYYFLFQKKRKVVYLEYPFVAFTKCSGKVAVLVDYYCHTQSCFRMNTLEIELHTVKLHQDQRYEEDMNHRTGTVL